MEHEKMETTKKQKQIKHIICISTNNLFHYIFNRITARCALTTFKISAHSLKIANIRGKAHYREMHLKNCSTFTIAKMAILSQSVPKKRRESKRMMLH